MSARAIYGILLAVALSTLSDGGLAANPITTTYPGSICQVALVANGSVQNRVIDKGPAGITPLELNPDYQGYPVAFIGPTRVICPLEHNASQTGGARAYLTVWHCSDLECGTVKTTCALYSVTWKGSYLAAATKTLSTYCTKLDWSGSCLEPLPDLIDINLTGPGKSDGSSAYVLDCTLNTGSPSPIPSELINIKLIEY